jgi:hypothetical protein
MTTETTTTTQSVETSHTMISGYTGTETETETKKQTTTTTETNAHVETIVISGSEVIIKTSGTLTAVILTEVTTTICTPSTTITKSDCGLVEICSSVVTECEGGDEYDNGNNEEYHKN